MNRDRLDCELGLVGLGVMGRNVLLNLADHGVSVAGLDLDPARASALETERAEGHRIVATTTAEEFVRALRRPRAAMMLVPAGDPVDSVVRDLLALLEPDDIIIDGGNSHFRDTERRIDEAGRRGVMYVGMGVSGGADGARRGPSLMPGGSRKAYEHLAPMLEQAAAHVGGEACVGYLGAGGAGHHVKMVHNGIEYGLMQLLAEAYDLMAHGLAMEEAAIAEVFERWRSGPLASFLVDITATILAVRDPDTGEPLVDAIDDAARQKGTGRWTSEEALVLQVPTPTIDAAVAARHLSSLQAERATAARTLTASARPNVDDPAGLIDRLQEALHATMLLTYAQGFALLQRASETHGFGTDLPTVARVWRGGCIIRAAVLDDLHAALADDPAAANVLLHAPLAASVSASDAALAEVVATAVRLGLPAPALGASQAYLAGLRRERLPSSLIQAQRDFFGHHGYRRRDRDGTHHGDWPDIRR